MKRFSRLSPLVLCLGLSVCTAPVGRAAAAALAVGPRSLAVALAAAPVDPRILVQPQSQTAALGATVVFSVTATGTEPLSYYWWFNGQPLAGANAPTLELRDLQAHQAGSYAVAVINAKGFAISALATLTLDKFFYRTGTVPSGVSSIMMAASTNGAIAVGYAELANGAYRPIAWRVGRGLSELPMLPNTSASTLYTTAADVSADGSVITGMSFDGSGDTRQAVIWYNDGQAVAGLGYLNPTATDRYSFPTAISADGQTIFGFATSTKANKTGEAFRWTPATGMTPLGFLGDDYIFSRVSWGAASRDGRFAVGYSYYVTSNTFYRGFRYSATQGLQPLGLLPGGDYSTATAVSADGTYVLGHGGSSTGPQLFRWTAAGGLVGLGQPSGFYYFDRGGISADGQVAVVLAGYDASETNLVDVGFVRNPKGFVPLEAVLAQAGLDMQGMTRLLAFGMSDDATLFWGDGVNPAGQREGWLARIPPGLAARATWPPGPPFITREPFSDYTFPGTTVTLQVEASSPDSVPSSGPLTYQWYLNGAQIPGAVSAALTMTNVQASQQGDYSTVVSNAYGSVASRVVLVRLYDVPPTLEKPLLTGTTFGLKVFTLPGRNYALEYKNSLADLAWTSLPSISGNLNYQVIADTNATVPHRFYRLRVQP